MVRAYEYPGALSVQFFNVNDETGEEKEEEEEYESLSRCQCHDTNLCIKVRNILKCKMKSHDLLLKMYYASKLVPVRTFEVCMCKIIAVRLRY